jgi:hypothetical protein
MSGPRASASQTCKPSFALLHHEVAPRADKSIRVDDRMHLNNCSIAASYDTARHPHQHEARERIGAEVSTSGYDVVIEPAAEGCNYDRHRHTREPRPGHPGHRHQCPLQSLGRSLRRERPSYCFWRGDYLNGEFKGGKQADEFIEGEFVDVRLE